MGVCSICLTVTQTLGPQDWPRSRNSGLKLNITLPKYRPSEVSKCWICTRFAAWLEIEDHIAFGEWHTKSLSVEYAGWGRVGMEGMMQREALPPFLIRIIPPGHGRGGGCPIELNFISSPEHATTASKRSSNSVADLKTLEKWFHTCSADHKRCRQENQVWYPTRLLYLGSRASDVRLITAAENPPDGPYMTLSHRWSKQRYMKLESSTMAQLQRAVDVVRLPQVFQDAMRIARHLGVHYLWIDSLCIKQDQDDLTDWAKESKMMGQVYACASMNISATWATQEGDNLLGNSCWTTKIPAQVELDISGQTNKYFVVDGNLWDEEVEEGPLNDRGWVFQERYLARRVVHFGQTQMAWECREWRAMEMYPDGLSKWLGVPRVKHEYDITPPQRTSPSAEPESARFAKAWQRMLTAYCECELTVASDKLMALEGIAGRILASRPADVYFAGVWKSTALYDLPWHRDDENRALFPISKTRWRAPSWSWATVDGEIDFPLAYNFSPEVRADYAEVKSLCDDSAVLLTKVNCKGTLGIEGSCLPLTLKWSEDKEIISFSILSHQFSTKNDPLKSALYFECTEEELYTLSCSEKLLFMPLFAMTRNLYGIILQKVRGPGEHRRIGAADISLMVRTDHMPDGKGSKNTLIRKDGAQLAWDRETIERLPEMWSKTGLMFAHFLSTRKPAVRNIYIS